MANNFRASENHLLQTDFNPALSLVLNPQYSGLTCMQVPIDLTPTLPNLLPQPFGTVYRAGIDVHRIRHFNARQALPYWCWAADVQMILAYYGIRVGQDEIVSRLYGEPLNLPGGEKQIVAALNALAAVDGMQFIVEATSIVNSVFEVLHDLLNDRPLLVGLQGPTGVGHAYVLSAITFTLSPLGMPIFLSVTLHDPWPDSPDMKEMSWAEFSRSCTLTVRARVSKATLH